MNPLTKFIQGLKLLVINPPLFLKYFRKHLFEFFCQKHQLSRIPQNKVKKIGKIVFDFNFDFPISDVYFYQIYFNFYEIATVEVIKKILKKGDIFIDIGANIGYLTAFGANLVGENGVVYSFEPVPLFFKSLKHLKELNPGYNIILNELALSDKTGQTKIDFAQPPHIGGSSMVLGLLGLNNIPTKTIVVKAVRLDEYIKEKKIDNISLIKIDVEGFEYFVLKGLGGFFKTSYARPPIICEICPDTFLGKDKRRELLKFMKQYGYEAYNIFNINHKIDIMKFKRGTNVVLKTSKQ